MNPPSTETTAGRRAVLTEALGGSTALAFAAVAGLAGGVSAKMADESGIGWLSDLGTFGAIWVLVLVVIGWRATTMPAAAGRAAVFFVTLTIGYYAYSTFVLGFPGGRLVQFWAVVSVTAVPVLAAGMWWSSRHRGPLPAAVLAAVGAIALVDGNTLPFWYAMAGDSMPPGFPYRPIQAAIEIGTALVAVTFAPRDWPTRAMAVALVLPLAWLASELIGFAVG